MKDITKYKNIIPSHAEGRVTIDLTDPITGKVKERVQGNNHVFDKVIFNNLTNNYWTDALSTAYFCLNDSALPLDTSMPLLMGQTVGFGIPSTAGSGNFRGAFNSANQVLGALSAEKIRWKYQYDFTTAQANGTIRNAGLTNQYFAASQNPTKMNRINHRPVFTRTNSQDSELILSTSDGRFVYKCNTSGVITIYDSWLNITTTIDKSAVTGTTAASIKKIGHDPVTKKYYIFVYSTTASLRRMFVFTDNTFATLETTYSPTNIVLDGNVRPIYVYGNNLYHINASNIWKADFVNNTAQITITPSNYSNVVLTQTPTTTVELWSGTTPLNNAYIVLGTGLLPGTPPLRAIVFDLASDTTVGFLNTLNVILNGYCTVPLSTDPSVKIPVSTNNAITSTTNAILPAFSTYILPSPITKTSANGMTATYELEVFW